MGRISSQQRLKIHIKFTNLANNKVYKDVILFPMRNQLKQSSIVVWQIIVTFYRRIFLIEILIIKGFNRLFAIISAIACFKIKKASC